MPRHRRRLDPSRGAPAVLAALFLTLAPPGGAAQAQDAAAAAAAPRTADGCREQGLADLRRGAFGEARAQFETAARLYAEAGDGRRRGAALVLLGQASQFLGRHREAAAHLEQALSLARAGGDPGQTATALVALGNVRLALGDGEQASRDLNEALVLARQGGYGEVAAAAAHDLGNLRIFEKNPAGAVTAYLEAAALAEAAGDGPAAARARVDAASAAFQAGEAANALSLLDRGATPLAAGPDEYARAHALINAGVLYADLRAALPQEAGPLATRAHGALVEALGVAERLGDRRAASYACGYLGRLYADLGQDREALGLTRRAVLSAQQAGASEALYRWHRQTGRLLARLGEREPAIAAYRLAMAELQAVREELSSCYANPESSYQKTAGAVALELVDLLLRRASDLGDGEGAGPYLAEARDTLELLKVFELREYFQDDCLDAGRFAQKRLDEVSEKAAVLYPILLPDRVELLVSFAGRLKRFTLPVGVDELTRETRELRRKLVKRTTWQFLPHAQKLYDWLIRPLEADLAALRPDTLVFVPDGPLRTIPLAALQDGREFLVSRYAIAVTPSLSLTDPRPVGREQVRLLSLGLTEAVQGFPGLPYVGEELRALQGLYAGELYLDDAFRLDRVEDALKKAPYSIVHIASHGQFGGAAGSNFLLAFDEKFTMERLGQYVGLFRFRDEPLDLLTLSACETAAGDDRAALGLAGVAVRAGARSALATLWHVSDPASYELVVEFYRQLQTPTVSRAAALQAAQRQLLADVRYEHPGYWAPVLMINNWL
ncbi:MAG: CHAT domain-containing protein, partial [Deferrisomatales bacterium]